MDDTELDGGMDDVINKSDTITTLIDKILKVVNDGLRMIGMK